MHMTSHSDLKPFKCEVLLFVVNNFVKKGGHFLCIAVDIQMFRDTIESSLWLSCGACCGCRGGFWNSGFCCRCSPRLALWGLKQSSVVWI